MAAFYPTQSKDKFKYFEYESLSFLQIPPPVNVAAGIFSYRLRYNQ